MEWRLRGGGGAGSGARGLAGAEPGRAAPSSPAPAGSGWQRRPGLTRCISCPRPPARRRLRAESAGAEEGAGGRVPGNPSHLPSARTRYLHHRLDSSREGSAPLDRCAASRGRSPESPGSLGFPLPSWMYRAMAPADRGRP